ncbi:MAG: T9SS type B sorting domain-containing protein, partial [Flavobacteriales bacterium]
NIVSDTTPYYVLLDSLGVGNYTIHVVDSFGCTFDSAIYVMDPEDYNLYVSIDSNSSFICEHDPTSITIDSVSGGHPNNLYYYWEGTSPITDSMYVPSGTYHAIILDTIYGCKDSLDFSFTAPNIISCNVTSTIVECFGDSTGSLQIDSIYGGTPPYTVQWGGIDTNNLFTGQYTLFITDALGCTYMENYDVLENPDVNLNETIYPPSCFGFSDGSIAIDLTGGTSPFNYLWLNGTGGPDSLFSLSVGIYVLQTTDDLGCIFSDTVVMSEPDNLVINFGGYTNPLSCNGGQTLINSIITGGTPQYSYKWNGSTSDTMSQIVATSGNYTLLVSDDNGCLDSNSILITEPALLEIVNTSFIQATCNVGATASLVVSGGTPPILYIWSNGDTTSSASDLTQGTQWVLVTDDCGGTDSISFEVEAYILETIINYYSLDNSAVVTVSPNSVGPPYSYQWYDENMNPILGETDTIIEDLCPSWYYCITTDANNCKDTVGVLAELNLPNGIINESTTTVYEDALLWGSEPYTYLWDNGNITAKGNICPGFHRVWVTDVNGCEVIGELNVEEILLTLSPSDIIIECDITNLDILLEVTATGGTGDYTYLWSNGQTENPINLSLNPGVYSVEVTDENFCNEDTVFHIAAMSSDCIPNVFSPNNDGSNDVWNLEDAFFYLDSEVRVYNRYGKLVFKSVGYNTPWDGKNQSGNNVEDGAYFYVINLGNNIEKIKGTVTIIQ